MKVAMTLSVSAFLLVALASCGTQPVVTDFDDSVTLAADYDTVWTAVIQLFAEGNWAIDMVEKDSGIIVTDRLGLDVPYENLEKYADCGTIMLNEKRTPSTVKFNVFVKRVGDATAVTINCGFRSLEMSGIPTYDCPSKGYLEAQLFEKLREMVE